MAIAFVAGATGYTGREVVRLLCERGVSTYAHVRPQSVSAWSERFATMGAKVDATPWQPEAIRATLERIQPTHVFLLLGTTRARMKEAAKRGEVADYETVDYGYTLQVIQAAEALTVKPRVVYVSMIGASKSGNAYAQVRYRLESYLEKSALPYVIARPAFITGTNRDENRPAERVGAVVFDGALGLVGALGGKGLRDRYASMTNTELATGLIRVALDPNSARRVVRAEELRRA